MKTTKRNRKSNSTKSDKRFWDDAAMKKHLQVYKDMLEGKNGQSKNPIKASRYWEEHIHDKVNSLITWSILLVDKEKADDEELRAELMQEVFYSILNRVKLDEKANSFSYLTSVCFTRTLNYLAGSSSLKGASFLCNQKIKSYRLVPADTKYNELDLEDGETPYKPFGDTIRIQRFLPRFQTIDDDVEVQQINSRPRFLSRIDLEILSEYIPDCKGLQKHKEGAYVVLDVLKEVEKDDEFEIPKDRHNGWLFNTQLKERLPGRIWKPMDQKLTYAVLREALSYYATDHIIEDETIHGFFGLLYPSADAAGDAGDGIS